MTGTRFPARSGRDHPTIEMLEPWPVLHTRGAGVRQVAEMLAAGPAHQVHSELPDAALGSRAVLLVARTVVTGDLLPQAVPHNVDLTRTRSVIGAIGTGPHGGAVARLTARVGTAMGIPGELVAASPGPAHDGAAEAALERSMRRAPDLGRSLVRVSGVDDLVRLVPIHALLVIGAPGGSWLQRQFFGPGRKLTVGAPCGALIVRDAPRRCFQAMTDWNAFGPRMRVADALCLLEDAAAPVVDNGRVIGSARRSVLAASDPTVPIDTVMEPPVTVGWDAPVTAAAVASELLDGAAVPVIGPTGRLIGEITPDAAGH